MLVSTVLADVEVDGVLGVARAEHPRTTGVGGDPRGDGVKKIWEAPTHGWRQVASSGVADGFRGGSDIVDTHSGVLVSRSRLSMHIHPAVLGEDQVDAPRKMVRDVTGQPFEARITGLNWTVCLDEGHNNYAIFKPKLGQPPSARRRDLPPRTTSRSSTTNGARNPPSTRTEVIVT